MHFNLCFHSSQSTDKSTVPLVLLTRLGDDQSYLVYSNYRYIVRQLAQPHFADSGSNFGMQFRQMNLYKSFHSGDLQCFSIEIQWGIEISNLAPQCTIINFWFNFNV